MLLKVLPFLCMIFLTLLTLEAADSTLLIINMKNTTNALPRNFRSDPSLQMSGSGQFSEAGLHTILKTLNHKGNFVIVDLRQEWHGFVNGTAISWYAPKDWGNKGKSCEQVQKEETSKIQKLFKHKFATLHQVLEKNQTNGMIEKSLPEKILVRTAFTERDLANKEHLDYRRVCVTDHVKPAPEAVQKFLNLVEHSPPNTWLHFHCAAGDGRTTTFMCLYDMLKNANKNSFEEIVQRQWKLGGINLAELPEPSSWKYQDAVERLEFLQKFYNQVKKEN